MADSKAVKKMSSKSSLHSLHSVSEKVGSSEDVKRKEEIKELMQKYPQILQICSVVLKEPDCFSRDVSHRTLFKRCFV